jgi:hypothetical protein
MGGTKPGTGVEQEPLLWNRPTWQNFCKHLISLQWLIFIQI